MEFPRLVYRATNGKEFSHELVENEKEHAYRLAQGWHDTVPEALEKRIAQPSIPSNSRGASPLGDSALPGNLAGGNLSGNASPTRAELEEKARELGISFQPAIGDKKLLMRINAALGIAPKG